MIKYLSIAMGYSAFDTENNTLKINASGILSEGFFYLKGIFEA